MSFRRNAKLEQELERTPAMRRTLRAAAEDVRQAAEHAAPRGTSRRGVAKQFRVAQDNAGETIVTNDDPFFHLVEFGSANNPPYAPLRRGARAAGLRLDEQAK